MAALNNLEAAAVPEAEALTSPVRDSAQARLALLAFVADEASETALRGGLQNVPAQMQIKRGNITHAIRHLQRESTPRALIVDIEGVGSPLNQLERLARVCTPDVKVLVVGENADIELYRRLVRDLGVTEYLYKPLTRDVVGRVFLPHIAGSPTETGVRGGGDVIAVCGARGGAGATTIAVNLALHMVAAERGHVVLLDLFLRRGATALMMGVKTDSGLRLALEQPDRADALLLERISLPIEDRLRLIAADEPYDTVPAPNEAGVRRVVELLRQRFNFIIVDLPLPGIPADHEVLRLARHQIVVMLPDVVSIRNADRLRLLSSKLGMRQTTFVLNRVGMPGGLELSLVEEGLGDTHLVQIPDLGKTMMKAANLGTPSLGQSAGFQRALRRLTQEVAGANAAATAKPESRSIFARMFRR